MNCNKCGAPVKVIPAGVSRKTGKEYGSFYKCEACGNSQNVGQQPPKQPKGNEQLDRIERKLDALMRFQGMTDKSVSLN